MFSQWPKKIDVSIPAPVKQKPYVPIHCHTSYSMFDACVMPADLVKAAASMGLQAISISDHGSLSGVFQFVKTCEEYKIKPVVGCEVYLNSKRLEDKKSRNNQHLCLFVMNQKGWKNLLKIHYDACKNGFYYVPRTDLDFISEHSEGLVATTACLASPLLKVETDEEAEKNLKKLIDVFGERLFVELQFNELEEQYAAVQKLLVFANKYKIKTCYGLDSHYAYPFDVYVQDILRMANFKKTINDEGAENNLYKTRKLYLKSYAECLKTPEELSYDIERDQVKAALEGNQQIADMCDFHFEKGIHFPKFKLNDEEVDSNKFLKNILNKNFTKAINSGRISSEQKQEYLARMNHEYDVICKCDYSDYFLLIWDMVLKSKSKGIFLAGGRGSAAGCLISFVLGISNIDPIKHGLLFERFIDVNRKDFPDIDLDWESERGNEVEAYLKEKYGEDHVTHVGTFSFFKTKSAVQTILKVLGESAKDVVRLTKFLESDHREGIIPADELDEKVDQLIVSGNKKLAGILAVHRDFGIQLAKRLAGNVRHSSLHAGGTIVTPEPIYNYVPVIKTKNDIATGFCQGGDGRTELEKMGLVKIDNLKVEAVGIVKEAIYLIKETKGIDLTEDIWKIDLEDKKVLRYYAEGLTCGIFQVDTELVTPYLKKLKPERFSDIVACLGLVRPGTLKSGEADKYIKLKNGEEKLKLIHPSLEEITKEFRGTFVFQEQLMELMHKVAGFPISETLAALKLLKQLYKSEGDQRLEAIVGKFKKGLCEISGFTYDQAEELVDMLKEFWLYVFNKSHATAYAVMGFQMMWLKVYYPTEFYCALLRKTDNKKEEGVDQVKTKRFIDEARKLGIKVFQPRFLKSGYDFTIEKENIIRCGMQIIVGVGVAGRQIEKASGSSLFEMMQDEKIEFRSLTKAKIQRLIKIGFFDGKIGGTELQPTRKQMVAAWDKFHSIKKDKVLILHRWNECIQKAMFEENGEYEEIELLKFEKEAFRFYFSNHPITKYKTEVQQYNDQMKEEGKGSKSMLCFPSDLISRNKKARIIGYISNVKETTVSKGAMAGRKMGIVCLSDGNNVVTLLVWPKYYGTYQELLKEGNIVLVLAELKGSEEGLSYQLNEAAKIGMHIVEPEKIFKNVLQKKSKVAITNKDNEGKVFKRRVKK